MKSLIKHFIILFVIVGISSGCEDFLSPSMDQQKTTDVAVQDVSDLQDAVRGILDNLQSGSAYGQDWIASPTVMSDNAYSNANSNRYITEDQLNFTTNSGYPASIWGEFYDVIASANFAIQSADDLESSPEVEQLTGQAYAMRALAHMNLMIAFGQQFIDGGEASNGIPYITSYNEGNLYPSRNSVSEVWGNIGDDFTTAADLLNESNFSEISVDYWTVRALQTRYYLYTEDYSEVISAAEEIITSENFSITPADSYISDWASTSDIPGSIFEIVFNSTERLANESIAYRYLDTEYGDISVTDALYDAHNSGDVRLDLYSEDTTEQEPFYRMTGKFPAQQGENNVPVIRYAEVILNYAEALAEVGREDDAKDELDKITSNRNAPVYSSGTVENVLNERRLELAMEGHRFYDIGRTGNDLPIGDSDSYRSSVVSSGDYRFALPIPNGEMDANSNISQNEGYN